MPVMQASNAGLLDETIDPKNVIVFAVTLGVAVFGLSLIHIYYKNRRSSCQLPQF